MFSATLDGAVGKLAPSVQRDPVRHEVGPAGPDMSTLAMRSGRSTASRPRRRDRRHRPPARLDIVFCRTRHGADRFAKQLGHPACRRRRSTVGSPAPARPGADSFATGNVERSSPPTSPPVGSTSTRRRRHPPRPPADARPTCTARAARPAPVRPAWSSRSWSMDQSGMAPVAARSRHRRRSSRVRGAVALHGRARGRGADIDRRPNGDRAAPSSLPRRPWLRVHQRWCRIRRLHSPHQHACSSPPANGSSSPYARVGRVSRPTTSSPVTTTASRSADPVRRQCQSSR